MCLGALWALTSEDEDSEDDDEERLDDGEERLDDDEEGVQKEVEDEERLSGGEDEGGGGNGADRAREYGMDSVTSNKGSNVDGRLPRVATAGSGGRGGSGGSKKSRVGRVRWGVEERCAAVVASGGHVAACVAIKVHGVAQPRT